MKCSCNNQAPVSYLNGTIYCENCKLNISDRIVAEFINPPIPIRNYDWEACRDNYDEGDIIGYGKTKEEAINDLLTQEKEEQE